MAFQYTFRADDISTWDADTRDLIENRDRELELAFVNLSTQALPAGGTAGQILSKINATDYNTQWIDNFAEQTKTLVKSDNATTLAKGAAVYTSGANGTNILVQGAIATSDATSASTLGLLDQSLALNDQGYVVTEGIVTGIDTSLATAGDPVWLSPTTAGGLVFGLANKPSAPYHLVYLGVVTRAHAVNGEINVHILNGWELEELHNVKIVSPATGQTIVYNATNSLWENSAYPAASLTGTIASARLSGSYTGITGVGTLTVGSIPASLLTGTTLPATIVSSSLTSLGTLTSLTVNGSNVNSPAITFGDWNQNGDFTAIRSAYGYLLFGSANGPNYNLYLRTETATGTVIIGGGGSGSTSNNTMTVGASSVSVTGTISASSTITGTSFIVGASSFTTTPTVSGQGIAFTGATVGGGTANNMGMRWANPNITGTVDNTVTAVLGTVSDRRLKTNINTLSNVLPTVRQLRPVTYNPLDVIGFNEDLSVIIGDKDPYDQVEGFVADEVEQVAPWLVQGGENGGYQSVNYALFAPMLVAAIQELDARIQQLETT